jgi:hypothetical protein
MSAWTPERREQQSQLAKKLVEEGKFGGKGRGQGRPRKPRASEKIAELVSDEAQLFYDRLVEITRYGKNMESIAAIRTALETEEKERKIQIEEDILVEDMNKNELLEAVWDMLTNGNNGITIDEAEFEPIEQEAISAVGEESESSGRTK